MRPLIVGSGRVLAKSGAVFHGFIHFTPNTNLHRVTCQPWCLLPQIFTRDMKRKATDSATDSKAKRQREPEADYCDVLPRKNEYGDDIWPASKQSIDGAREFLKDW